MVGMKLRTTTTAVINDIEIETCLDVAENIDPYISEDGNTVVLAVHDTGQVDYDFPEGVGFVQGNSSFIHFHKDIAAWVEDQQESGLTVFPVGAYEHGLISYTVHGQRVYPDMQWDYGVVGAIAMPEDYPEPLEAAQAILEEYSNWCNGSVYGIVTFENVDGTWEDTDSVWGFIGSKYTQEVVSSGSV
jgi:hypothetical protein